MKYIYHFIVKYFILVNVFLVFSCYSQTLPTGVLGLKVWLRADSGITVTNSVVSSWQNLSNSGLDVFSPVSVNGSPIYSLNNPSLNNKPSVNFNGLNDGLISNNYIKLNTSATTIIMVAKTNTFKPYAMFASYGISMPGSWNFRLRGTSAKLAFTNGNNNLGAGENNTNSSDLTLNDYTILFGNVRSSDGRWETGENSIIEDSVFTAFPQADSNLITFGYRNDNIGFLDFNLAEVLIFDKILNDTDYNTIITYIRNRYTSPVQLGPAIYPVCDSSITLNTGTSYFSNVLWSDGTTTNTITINKNDTINILATDVFGFTSHDSIILKLIKPPLNFHKLRDTIICNSSIVWDTGLNPLYYNFLWSNGITTNSISINSSDSYSLSIIDTSGCVTNCSPILITFDAFEYLTSLGPDIPFFCAGNSITLTSGLSPALTYTWSDGSHNPSLLINTTGQYSVVVTNTNNCVARDTINVNVTGFAPIANFTTSVGCINSIVSFTDLSSPPSGNTISSYQWNFGDATSATNTSTLTNPSHTYTNTGSYTVSLKVITNAGCEQTTTKTLTVFPKPTVNFSSGLSCQNDSTAFSSLCTSSAGYSITSLNWNFGDPISLLANTSNLTSPKHLFSSQNNYTITLTATNNVGCKDSVRNIITVRAQVKADFTVSSPCANSATIFQDNSIVPAPSSNNNRIWNLGSGPINNVLSVSKTYTSSGVYSVSLTVNGYNQCSSSISKIITIFSSPTASFVIPAFCEKDTITASNLSVAQSGVISSYNWKLNSVSFSSIQNPTLSIPNSGSYPVRLTTINSFGCKDSITKTVLVNPLPNADFTTNPNSYYYINSPVSFIPSTTNASSYLWNLSSIGTSTVQSPTTTYNTEGTYTVSLNLQDLLGCKNSFTKTLLVAKRFLDVAVLNVNSSKDNDGFMTVQADIANYGTIPVSTLDLSYQISDGGNIKETWNGTLNPNSFFSYTFTSKTATQISSANNITCVDIKKANSINDENQNNNKLCNALNSDEITVSNPIPNPTNAEISLPIILNKEIDFSISIYNSNGQIQYEEKTQKGIIGLNLITLPTANYARGCYVIKTVIDDKIFIKKFIKISYE